MMRYSFLGSWDSLSRTIVGADLENVQGVLQPLKLLETNRVCPCNACATAPKFTIENYCVLWRFAVFGSQKNKKTF